FCFFLQIRCSPSFTLFPYTTLFRSEVAQNLFGVSVSGVGDFNGDGFDDVIVGAWDNGGGGVRSGRAYTFFGPLKGTIAAADADLDRKSTRLNSSHVSISYAVFCLKK